MTMFSRLLALPLLAVASPLPPSACGPDQPSTAKDCNHADMGSCGNACCFVEFDSKSQSAEAHKELMSLLKSGLDGHYTYVTGGHPDPTDDLRPFHVKQAQFILQGTHSTPLFNGSNSDIIDVTFVDSTVRMFSSSRVHGALGDNGQNYKTLAHLHSMVPKTQNEVSDLRILYGCGGDDTDRIDATVKIPKPDAQAGGLPPSACGPKCDAPDCNKKDMGSCGNACCFVEISFPSEQPENVYNGLKDMLNEGIDGHYSYVTGGDPNPGDDLRPYNISKPRRYEFILQGRHSTPLYNGTNADILNFNIAGSDDNGSELSMFSSSRIHGALGDAGQNFKTLSYLADALAPKLGVHSAMLKVVYGCGSSPAASESTADAIALVQSSVSLRAAAESSVDPIVV